MVSPSRSSVTPSAVNPKRAPSRCSSATSPAALCPNRKFSPTMTPDACSRSTSARCTNSSGGSWENSSVNGSAQKTSTPSCSTSLGPPHDRGQHRRVRAGPHDLGRVRDEGHQHARHAALPGLRDGPADDLGVPAVHAVEHPDGDHAMAPSGRDGVESMPALHEREPTVTVGDATDGPTLSGRRPRPSPSRTSACRSAAKRPAQPAGSVAQELAPVGRPACRRASNRAGSAGGPWECRRDRARPARPTRRRSGARSTSGST